jgi:hypothetical protein
MDVGLRLIGDSRRSTKIRLEGASAGFQEDRGGDASVENSLFLENMQIVGDNTGSQTAVFIENVHSWTLRDLSIKKCDVGLNAVASWIGGIYNCRIKGNSSQGVLLEEGPDGKTNDISVIGTSLNDNNIGLEARNMSALWVKGGDAESNNTAGIKLETVKDANISTYLENNPEHVQIGVDGGRCRQVSVTESFLSIKENTTGIHVNACDSTSIKRNHFLDVGNGAGTPIKFTNIVTKLYVSPNNDFDDKAFDANFEGPGANNNRFNAQKLNDGKWPDEIFSNLDEMISLAYDVSLIKEKAPELIVTRSKDGLTQKDLTNAPPGTVLRGARDRAVQLVGDGSTIDGNGNFSLVRLGSNEQKVKDLVLGVSGSGIDVRVIRLSNGDRQVVENVRLSQGPDDGFWVRDGNDHVLENVDGDSVSGNEFDVGATRARINSLGSEAAGAGNTPAASNWKPGEIVENTDDGVVYQLLQDNSTWVQIS